MTTWPHRRSQWTQNLIALTIPSENRLQSLRRYLDEWYAGIYSISDLRNYVMSAQQPDPEEKTDDER